MTTTSSFKGLAGYGLCECGCGQATTRAKQTKRSEGAVKGILARFISGHNAIAGRPEYLVDEDTGCWVWQRYLDDKGYGGLVVRGVRYKAHRVLYERHKGPIPDGLVIDHLCSNPRCVNPDHLEAVTQRENMRRAGYVKLTEEQARAIRNASGTLKALAARFGVHFTTIQAVKEGRTWKDAAPKSERNGPS